MTGTSQVLALVAVIYRYGPCRAPARWKWLTLGSLATSVLWLAMSTGFSWYVSRFGSYNETYGSLGAVIGFMTWLWLSFSVILLGAELNAEIEHQTARDTTTGAPLPLGARDAEMADTVGPSIRARPLSFRDVEAAEAGPDGAASPPSGRLPRVKLGPRQAPPANAT